MKKKTLFLLLVSLLLVSVSCNLPLKQTNTSGTSAIDMRALMNNDFDIGKYVESDLDQNGENDYFEYYLPMTEVQPRVYAQRVNFANHLPEGFIPGIAVNFRNDTTSPQEFTYTFEIPKEFAQNLDMLYFDPLPDAVVNADPIVDYTIKLDTKKQVDAYIYVERITGNLDPDKDDDFYRRAFLTQALPDVVKYCNSFGESGESRQNCYMRLVQGFIDYVSPDVMEVFCDELPELYASVCLAEVKKDPGLCANLDGKRADLCRKLYLADKCRNTGGTDEERMVCLGQGAIELGMDNVCDQLPLEDLKNDCHARIRKDADFCRKIDDTELKSMCLAEVGDAGKKQAGGKKYNDYNRWFPATEDRTDCKRFDSIAGYPVIYVDNAGWNLLCRYGTTEGDIFTSRGVLYIRAFESESAAKRVWDEEEGPNAVTGNPASYQELIKWAETVYTKERGDSWEHISYRELVNPTGWFYEVHCGRLYLNTIITYRHELMPQKNEELCGRISLEAMLLIDSKMK